MKISDIKHKLENGERIVKTISDTDKSVRLVIVPSMKLISYAQYRKLLFEHFISLRIYDRFNKISYYEKD